MQRYIILCPRGPRAPPLLVLGNVSPAEGIHSNVAQGEAERRGRALTVLLPSEAPRFDTQNPTAAALASGGLSQTQQVITNTC